MKKEPELKEPNYHFNEKEEYIKDGMVYCKKCHERLDIDPIEFLHSKIFARNCRCKREEKLPHAKKFKNWVTKEVLPSIRKHGGYIRGQENLSNEELLAQAILVANNVIVEKTQRIKELEPKANYYDKLVDKNLLTNFRNTAK